VSSDSNADNKGGARERFSRPFVSLGIVLAFLLLLFALFPEKGIIETMARLSDKSPLALGYREAILRTRPGDMEYRLKLVDGLLDTGQFSRALRILDDFKGQLPSAFAASYLGARCRALRGILADSGITDSDRQRLKLVFSRTVGELAVISPEALDREVPVAQIISGKPETCRENARLFFRPMKEVRGVTERRTLFMKGVLSLQACNLAGEALSAGASNMSGLESDQRTLLFMTKAALAAGKPQVAEYYITRALAVDRGRKKDGGG
jgi:hypothetical protein